LLLTASSSKASLRVLSARALPFFSARSAAFSASSMEAAAFELALLGAIAGMLCRSTNGGYQMLELANPRTAKSNGGRMENSLMLVNTKR
jgi:hypothetical protein